MPFPSTSLYPSTGLYPSLGGITLASALGGTVTLTSELVRAASSRVNLIGNPSFEVNNAEYTATANTFEHTRLTTEKIVGSYGVRVGTNAGARAIIYGATGAGTPAANTYSMPVTAGQAVTISAYLKRLSGGTLFRFNLLWFDAAGAQIVTLLPSYETLPDAWTRKSYTETAPTGAVKFGMAIDVPSTTSFYTDAWLAEHSATLGTYFDGSSVSAGYTYAWTGTAHASTSTEVTSSGPRTIASPLGGTVTLTSSLAYTKRIASPLGATVTLTSALHRNINSQLSGAVTLTSVLSVNRVISSTLSGTVTLTSSLHRHILSNLSGSVTLTSVLEGGAVAKTIDSRFTAQAVLYSELGYVVKPAELGTTPLGKLVSFNVSTSATPLNPAEGAGGAPSVSAGYIKGVDPEFALGENNVLSWGTVGTYEGEVVRLSLPEGSDVASISQDTALTLLNTELSLFPFIDAAPSLWTAARAIDYWSQQTGLFYDKVPGDCIAYASGFGHADSYAAQSTARFYERLAGGATSTAVANGRSVKTLGSAVTGTTAFHELPETTTPVSVPKNRRLVASIGLGLRGSGRTATVTWNMVDANKVAHNITLTATSEGSISAAVGGSVVDTATVPAGADYRITFSLERLSVTSAVGKLTVHTDDLAGNGGPVYSGLNTGISYAFPVVAHLTSITHASAGGSGAEMLRWGTYLTVALGHPSGVPATQKALSQTKREFGFVSGFEGNVWAMLQEYCAITRQDVSFLDSKLTVIPRRSGLTAPLGNFSRFSRDAERREKYKQVAVVNKQSKAVTTNDAILWRADSVYQVAAREVFETTVQTDHSILSLVQPAAVNGIWPFPYKQGGGQYVVTGADGYIIAPEWWADNGGKVEVSLTGKAGEIAIKITAPTIDTVRAPYRISEGEADRPAFYIAGSGILNDPKEVHVGTGAKNAREGFDSLFESPFIAGPMETYDTAAAMAAQYSASVADVSFELPNDFYTPSRFGQFPAGMRFTDGKRAYRIRDASQSHSKVSGNAEPHTTIGDYVASYPAGATIADEKARHRGRTIKQFNISPLKGQ